MNYTTIEVNREGRIGWLRLNRPKAKNALSVQSFEDIHRGIDELAADEGVGVIVIIGNGGVFSSGRDFRDPDVPPDFEDRRSRAFHAVEYCPKPTIAAVAGYAITGGLTLALACDLIVAAEDAVFQDTHAQLGIITLRASRLYEVLGPLRAKELLFTSRRVTGADALAMGLVNRAVPADQLEATAGALALEIARHEPGALRAIKSVINDVIRKDQQGLLELEELAKRRFSDLKPEQGSLAVRDAQARAAAIKPE